MSILSDINIGGFSYHLVAVTYYSLVMWTVPLSHLRWSVPLVVITFRVVGTTDYYYLTFKVDSFHLSLL